MLARQQIGKRANSLVSNPVGQETGRAVMDHRANRAMVRQSV